MATVTREQRAIEAWAKAMATAENYAVDPHQHIARLVEAGEQMAALLAPKDAAAQAPPASDPPGLVEVVAEFQRAHADYQRAKHEDVGQEFAWSARKSARDAVLAYHLPASPHAETKPTIRVGDVVRVADSVAVIGSANAASFWGRQVIDAIYRDPLWRRPASPQAKED